MPLYGTKIGLADILIITIVILAMSLIMFSKLNFRRIRKSREIDSNINTSENPIVEESLFSDSPITTEDEDELRRLPFAQKLVRKICELNTSKGARSLAITAPWGNGKTSFLNLVKTGLQQNGYEVLEIVPWNLNPDKSITSHFFEEIIKKLGGLDHKVARILKKYSNMLASVRLDFFSSLSSNISISELAKSISMAMNNNGIKVVIIFDDIDRLGANEIEEVFRIIRGSANFTNFIFLSAFDKRYVQQALRESNPAFNEHYIEKFFEMEFTLPELRKERIEEIIKKNISWLADRDKKEFEDYISSGHSLFKENQPYTSLTNLRMIYRWLNSLKYRYEILKEECKIADLADLEMINLLFPQVYSLLSKDYHSFFEIEDYQNTYKLWNESMSVSPDSDWLKSIRQKSKRNLMNYCKKELEMSDVEIQTLTEILERLIPNHRYRAESKAFSNPNYTQRYFDGILDSADIPQLEFDEMIAGVKSFKDFIDNDDDEIFAHSLLLLCVEAKPKEMEDLKTLFSLIYYASAHYHKFGLSYYNIKEKLYGFSMSNEDMKSLFKGLMLENKFSRHVFLSLIPSRYSDRNGWLDIFDEDEIDYILACLFKKAIEEGYPFNYISELYDWTKVKNGGEDIELNYECKIKDIRDMYKLGLAKYSITNIKYLIYMTHPENDKFYPSTNFTQLWGSWDSYESYLRQNQFLDDLTEISQKQLDEFKDFVNNWENNDKSSILYTFRHISLNSQ